MNPPNHRARRSLWLAVCGFGALALAGCSTEPMEPADWILTGLVYPLVEDNPSARAEAVAVRGDRIVAVGKREHVLQYRGHNTHIAEIPWGHAVLPGLADAHGHVLSLGLQRLVVDLTGAASYDEVIARVKERAASAPEGAWILGRGWDQNLWPEKAMPTHDALSAAVPDHPVWLVRVDGHAGLANRRALAAAGITAKTRAPEGGRIERRRGSHEPTGVLVDKAMALVGSRLPPVQGQEMLSRVLDGLAECASLGLTSVHDAGTSPATLDIYRHLGEQRLLPVRVYAMRDARERWEDVLAEPVLENLYGGRLTVRAVKFSLDGALGSRGAALLAPYADASEHAGLLRMEREDFRRACAAALEKGYQVAAHAIGDAANRMALDVFEEVFRKTHDPRELRWRIEHAQAVAPDDIPRFARMSVLPSMQFVHFAHDMPWAVERLGEERMAGAYAWRKFRKVGCRIPGGSDFPVAPANPFEGIYAALTRRDRADSPPEGWFPSEKLAREEAFLAYTAWAAYAAFAEGEQGVLRPGAYADLILVDRDVMTCSVEALRATRVVFTMVGGQVVYAAPGFMPSKGDGGAAGP